MRGQYVQITKIRYLCFDLVHSRYTRMAGFGRREIELMQALCIYNIYIEYYSVGVYAYFELDMVVMSACRSPGVYAYFELDMVVMSARRSAQQVHSVSMFALSLK